MTIVSFNLGPVPAYESCAPVGYPGYEMRSQLECKVFRRMLERVRPVPQEVSARYVVRSFPHDFGDYREVCIDFDAEEPEALAFASEVESNTPDLGRPGRLRADLVLSARRLHRRPRPR